MHITFELILFILLIWLLIYILVDRICRCIEHGHIAKSFGQSSKVFEKAVNEIQDRMKNNRQDKE